MRRTTASPRPVPACLVVKNGVEHLGPQVGRNAGAGVGKHDFHIALLPQGEGAHLYFPFISHGLERIDGQVEKHLLELLAVEHHRRQAFVQADVYLHLLVPGPALHQKEGVAQQAAQVHLGGQGLAGARKKQERLDNTVHPVHFVKHHG